MGVTKGMILRIKHPEISPDIEWLVTNVTFALGQGGQFFELKSTGRLPQTLVVPSYITFTALDNTLPPVLDMTGSSAMDKSAAYHQDRRFVKRIIDGLYNTKLKVPHTEYPLTATAQASWDKTVKQEQERNLHLFKADLQAVCGKRTAQTGTLNFGTLGIHYTSESNFDKDFIEAQNMWRNMTTPKRDIDYSSWSTFMGIYACYRKVIETEV